METDPTLSVITLLVTSEQKSLIEQAAAWLGETAEQFCLRVIVDAAYEVLRRGTA